MNKKVDNIHNLVQAHAAQNKDQNAILTQHSNLIAQTLESQQKMQKAHAEHLIHHQKVHDAKPQAFVINVSLPRRHMSSHMNQKHMFSQMNQKYKHGHQHSLGYDHKHHRAHVTAC